MEIKINQNNLIGKNVVKNSFFSSKNNKENKKPFWSSIKKFYLILCIIVALGTIYSLITSNKTKNNMEIIQNNTFGPNTVNVGTQQRYLTPEMKSEFQKIPLSSVIKIEAILGDAESIKFAEELRQYLNSLGHNVKGILQVMYDKPVFGIHMEVKNSFFTIIIGHNQ